MKARETVFSLVAGSPCPRTIYFNSLSQPLGEEFSGRSIHPSIKCRISLVISIIEDRSNQFFPITFFAFKIYMSSLKVNYLCSAVLPEIWIKMNIWSQNEQSWHFWYQIFSQPSDSTRATKLFTFRVPPMGSHLFISWVNQSLDACNLRSVPSSLPSSLPSESSIPLLHGY